MSWFNRYFNKWSQWRDEGDWNDEDIRDFSRGLPKHWMERMPNGKFFWQVSLDKAMQNGKLEHGEFWDRKPTSTLDDPHDTKKAVFYEWLHKIPEDVIYHAKNMIDDYLEKSYGFRALDTESTPHQDIEPMSVEDLENSFRS